VDKNKWLKIVLGLAFGLLLLWWLFHDTDWPAVWASIRQVHPGWILVNQAAIWLGFFTRILRWRYIVRAGGAASFRSMFSATQIGFLANFTLPARVGEVVRALVLTRLTAIPFSKSFAMVALDRVTDLIGLIAVMLVAALVYRPAEDIVLPPEIWSTPIPADIIRSGAMGTALFLSVVVGTLVLLYIKQGFVLRLSDTCVGFVSRRLAQRVHALLGQFAEGLHVFRSAGDMAKAIGYSLVTWATFLVSYGTLLLAFGLTCPWYAPFVITAMVAVVISLPGAPGFVGQFHVGVMVGAGVVIPGIAFANAQALALLAHVLVLLPILVAGVFCLFWEDLRLLELTRASARTQQED